MRKIGHASNNTLYTGVAHTFLFLVLVFGVGNYFLVILVGVFGRKKGKAPQEAAVEPEEEKQHEVPENSKFTPKKGRPTPSRKSKLRREGGL